MPGRNIYKDYVPESYYHVYNRGVASEIIFRDDQDYSVFLSLLKRYLGSETSKNSLGIEYPSYRDEMELLTFCLMPSHFHMLIYQYDQDAMRQLLKSVSVAYSMHFNKKYKRFGPLFQQRYRASLISNDSYLLHISRYIHLNPDNYTSWEWSSLPYYLNKYQADWMMPARILELFEGDNYLGFLDEYKDRRDELNEIKHELANQS